MTSFLPASLQAVIASIQKAETFLQSKLDDLRTGIFHINVKTEVINNSIV